MNRTVCNVTVLRGVRMPVWRKFN